MLNMGRFTSFTVALLVSLTVFPVKWGVFGLHGNLFDFTSFTDPLEWVGDHGHGPYAHTCSRIWNDRFREPREQEYRDALVAPKEALSPVRIFTKDAIPAPEKVTLHIYNNAPVRRAYSVSYGFQRNKECINGEDWECVIGPDFGRVRAVVLNAERYKTNENLNFIKDHFLIEEQEKFVTIINGGTHFERKFYEAVFLGGFDTSDPMRSTHQIDGKSYPMEIYMYFVDETVPAVTSSTLLVVLVEESEKENPYVKPIVNTVHSELYAKERQYLEKHQAATRRQKLFQDLDPSTAYDIHDFEGKAASGDPIIQESLSSSIHNEDDLSINIETYELMQTLLSKIYFYVEDRNTAGGYGLEFRSHVIQFRTRSPLFKFYPVSYSGIFGIAFPVVAKYARTPYFSSAECTDAVNFMAYVYPDTADFRQRPDLTEEHLLEEIKLAIDLCNVITASKTLEEEVHDETLMANLTYKEKYAYVRQYQDIVVARDELNKRFYEHFFNETPYNHTGDKIRWVDEYQKRHFVEGVEKFAGICIQLFKYIHVSILIGKEIQKTVEHDDFLNQNSMDEIFHFLQYGTENYKMEFPRGAISKGMRGLHLPHHHKRRGLVEHLNMEYDEAEIREDDDRTPLKALINQAFQVSWLIPPSGGYYYYKGSSPVPPCARAQNVIVFKKPISMSREQIDILTRIPTSFNKYHDTRNTLPLLHDLKFRTNLRGSDTKRTRYEEVVVPLFDQKRNHLFLGHDGVHKNAVEESERLRRKRSSSPPSRHAGPTEKVLLLSIVATYYFMGNMNLLRV